MYITFQLYFCNDLSVVEGNLVTVEDVKVASLSFELRQFEKYFYLKNLIVSLLLICTK